MDTSYLTQQVGTIISQLHGLFDDIGVPHNERDARESELFSALSETLHSHLRQVTDEKHEMTEEAHRLIKTIKQMEASLDDSRRNVYDDMKVTYPLTDCIQILQEKHNTISKLHRERFEQIKKLVQALESYASHLEPSFVKIKLPPTSPNAVISPSFDLSPSYVTSVDNEFTRVYEEYTRRVSLVQTISEEIIKLWAELGTPQAQTDNTIVEYYRDAPEQLGLHQDDLASLKQRRDRLIEEKRGRERKLKDLRNTVEGLWDRLGVEAGDRRAFLASNRGCGLRTINEFEDELSRLNELKRQNMHLFVEDARVRLQELWDSLYFSEEEMLEFTPAFSDVYSDALLSAHEQEITRLEALKEQRAPTLAKVDRHRTLVKERDDLQASSQDASRLMARGVKGQRHDPGKLLREEKMRKRIAKELPKVEAELRKTLEDWEEEYGRPFLVHGERYLDELAAAASTKAPPARSKTPSVAPATVKTKPNQSAQRNQGTVRGPPRSKTPTANLGRSVNASMISNANTSTIGRGNLSPSKIPARAPLSNLQHGNNSPERKHTTQKNDATVRKMAPPPRAPPPKMQDLFRRPDSAQPSSSRDTPAMDRYNSHYDPERSASVVRTMPPDDPYEEPGMNHSMMRSQGHGYHNTSVYDHSMPPPPRPAARPYHDYHSYDSHDSRSNYSESTRPPTRQISATSSSAGSMTTANTVSGSENWETYDDASEPEMDASDAYYAKLRAARAVKRATPEGGYGSPRAMGKKMKGIRGMGGEESVIVEEDGRFVRVPRELREVSGQSWEDEEAY